MKKKLKTLITSILLVPCVGIIAGCGPKENEDPAPSVVDEDAIVALSDTEVNLYVGGNKFITATTSPAGQMVNWGSENEAIATINRLGKITGVSAGTTRVYAEINGEKKYCNVTILETSIDVDTSITLAITEVSGEVSYGTKQLDPKINNESVTCTYTSENDNIATVSNEGLVTASGVGTTKIIVKYGENISKEVNVTVTGPVGYYAGVSAQASDVASNAGKWFYHTEGSASNFKSYHLGDKFHLEMSTTGANRTFLRYQVPNFQDDEIYQFTTTINVTKDCFVRISSGSYVETHPIRANTDTTISMYGLNLISNNCLGFLFLASESATNYLKGFNATVTDFSGEASVGIDKRNVVLNVENESAQLVASEEGVTWESKDTNVVTVDANGLLTKVGNGTTTVWATKNFKKCFTTVVVEDKKLTLNKKEELIGVGQTLTISVDEENSAGINQNDIVWTSSNEDVATVANGVVTAKKGGYTRITAIESGVSASVVVGVYGEENKYTGSASNFAHKKTTEMDSVGPGWYKLNYYVDSIVAENGVVTLTNTTKTFKDVQQIRMVVDDGNGGVYHGDYFIRYTVESGMKDSNGDSITMTCASQRNGDSENVSPTASLNFGESETLQNVVHGVSDNSGFLSFKLKYLNGYGTIIIKDIYIVKLS